MGNIKVKVITTAVKAALQSCLAKVLESIVGQWIRPILEPQFDPHQSGCRRNRSTTHALTAVLHAWQSTLDRGGAARAVLVDFKKAFDLVNHNLLLQKLFTRGVPHCLLKWFFSITTSENWKEPFGMVTAQWGDAAGFTVRTTLIPGPN